MTQEQIAKLKGKLPADAIATRQQSGQTLSYIEGHYAIRVANDIFGHDGWDRFTTDLNLVQAEQKQDKWYIGYTAVSRITVGQTTRMGVGFGQGIDRDLGRAHESAIKEAETDAMKRALMTFGDPLGLALYDKAKEHVEPVSKATAPKQTAKTAAPQAPAAEPSDDIKRMGEWVKHIGFDKESFKAFSTQYPNWASIAVAAQSEGVTDKDGLIFFAQGLK